MTALSVTGLPAVKSISPETGSLYGGSIVTITGNGFDKNSQIKLGAFSCVVISAVPNQLICKTVDSTTVANRKRSVTDNVLQIISIM